MKEKKMTTNKRNKRAPAKKTPAKRAPAKRAPLRAPARPQARRKRVGASIPRFNVKDFIVSNVTGFAGGLAIKYATTKAYDMANINSPMVRLGLDLGLSVGIPLLLRKNKKALKLVLPMAGAYFVGTMADAYTAYNDGSLSLAGGINAMQVGRGVEANNEHFLRPGKVAKLKQAINGRTNGGYASSNSNV